MMGVSSFGDWRPSGLSLRGVWLAAWQLPLCVPCVVCCGHEGPAGRPPCRHSVITLPARPAQLPGPQIQPIDTVKVRGAEPRFPHTIRQVAVLNVHALSSGLAQVRLQVAGEAQPGKVPSPFTVLRNVVAKEGVFALYSG